jgi:iron complex outermembrane receptor protein
VPRIPPYRIGGGLGWQGQRLDAGITVNYYGKQTHYGEFDTATPAYTNVDAQIAVRPFKAWPGWNWRWWAKTSPMMCSAWPPR